MTPPPPAHSLAALRAWMREVGLTAIVVQDDGAPPVPVKPIRLPVGAAGPHGACNAAAATPGEGAAASVAPGAS